MENQRMERIKVGGNKQREREREADGTERVAHK